MSEQMALGDMYEKQTAAQRAQCFMEEFNDTYSAEGLSTEEKIARLDSLAHREASFDEVNPSIYASNMLVMASRRMISSADGYVKNLSQSVVVQIAENGTSLDELVRLAESNRRQTVNPRAALLANSIVEVGNAVKRDLTEQRSAERKVGREEALVAMKANAKTAGCKAVEVTRKITHDLPVAPVARVAVAGTALAAIAVSVTFTPAAAAPDLATSIPTGMQMDGVRVSATNELQAVDDDDVISIPGAHFKAPEARIELINLSPTEPQAPLAEDDVIELPPNTFVESPLSTPETAPEEDGVIPLPPGTEIIPPKQQPAPKDDEVIPLPPGTEIVPPTPPKEPNPEPTPPDTLPAPGETTPKMPNLDEEPKWDQNKMPNAKKIKEKLVEKYEGVSGKLSADELETVDEERWGNHRLQKNAAAGMRALSEAFKKKFGEDIQFTDSYRSLEQQIKLKKEKPTLAGTPGTSNHGWGFAVDFASSINNYGTKEHEWMQKNAGKFGFVNPEWAQEFDQNGTPNKQEPWHWEFEGKPAIGTKYPDAGKGEVDKAPERIVNVDMEAAKKLSEQPGEAGRAGKIMAYLLANTDLTPGQISGMIGNFMVESPGLKSTIKQYGGGPGRGLAQWEIGFYSNGEPKRGQDLLDFAKKRGTSWDDFDTQVAFIVYELKGKEKSAYKHIGKAKVVSEAAIATRKFYERPSAHHDQRRIDGGLEVYVQYDAIRDTLKQDSSDREDLAGGERKEAKLEGSDLVVEWANYYASNPNTITGKCSGHKNCAGMCGRATAVLWGYTSAGLESAAKMRIAAKNEGKLHAAKTGMPVGALLYYKGSNQYEHVAVYIGDGKVATNVTHKKTYEILSLSAADDMFKYLGWAKPDFNTAKDPRYKAGPPDSVGVASVAPTSDSTEQAQEKPMAVGDVPSLTVELPSAEKPLSADTEPVHTPETNQQDTTMNSERHNNNEGKPDLLAILAENEARAEEERLSIERKLFGSIPELDKEEPVRVGEKKSSEVHGGAIDVSDVENNTPKGQAPRVLGEGEVFKIRHDQPHKAAEIEAAPAYPEVSSSEDVIDANDEAHRAAQRHIDELNRQARAAQQQVAAVNAEAGRQLANNR